MPPVNNNFASAIDLGAYSSDVNPGVIDGDNFGATAQAGEPANNGKTVWYKFTTPGVVDEGRSAIYFSTLYNPSAGVLPNPLRTVLQAFTGPDLAHLTEIAYLSGGNWTSNYAGWEFGSYIAFKPAASTTYYIRVDGVGGAEGYFPLSFDAFYLLYLGACDECAPTFGTGYLCKGVITITDLNTAETTSFGGMPAGHYRIGYCGGVAVDPDNEHNPWSVTSPGDDGPFYAFWYDNGGGPNSGSVPLVNYPDPPTNYGTQTECEEANRCDTAEFDHVGGSDISLDYRTSVDGPTTFFPYRNPSFALYQLKPVLTMPSACASWVSHGVSATCTFDIKNFNDIIWDAVTATLSATGGVSSPSAPLTGQTLPANGGTRSLTFTFNATNPNVTATLTLDSLYFPAPVVLTIFLGPILTPTIESRIGPGACSGSTSWGYFIRVTNNGFWAVTPTATCSFSAGIKVLNGSCTQLSSIAIAPGLISCSGDHHNAFLNVHAPAVPTPAILIIALADAEVSYGSFTIPVTVPN